MMPIWGESTIPPISPGDHGRISSAIGKITERGPRQTQKVQRRPRFCLFPRGPEDSGPTDGGMGDWSPILAYFACPARWRISARIWRKATAKVEVVTVTAVRSATGSARMTASTLSTGSTAGRI